MNSIQRKILTMSLIVLFIMVTIWMVLTYYNQKTQEQYNDILQRYLRMNEVTDRSHQTITALNDYLQKPTALKQQTLNQSNENIMMAKQQTISLRNKDNTFTLTSFINMIDSLVASADLSVMFLEQGNGEQSAEKFEEATRIDKYIAETTVTLIDKEVRTYDAFYRGIIEQSAELKRLGIWLLSLITIMLLLFTYWFSLSITRPIQKLTIAAKELSRGRFDKPIAVHSNDEISFLAKTFDRMRININNLISEIQQKAQLESELQQNKLLLKESQLISLQSQINPHFLFNTLDILSKKAYLDGSEETSDLIANVAGLLRYNLRRLDRAVTLEEELSVILKYIEIQSARFTDRLRFVLEVDENCLQLLLPCLTLQPIIENAVIHAVEPLEDGGTISLRIYEKDNLVLIEIEDDGTGMTAEKANHILTEGGNADGVGHSTGIGFSNVVKRLRLFVGDDDVIEIRSAPQEGTKVTIKMPIVGSVAEHVEIVNR
ncbi:two-component sensor histidine kinase [Paenibacillus sp. FSL A5-0031]|uniref:sensor histidine kinase n=1 Tax=Paenibacillus sp. FSL A5-0031 TaxID=1920420 RepID=UPI00096BEAE9|nr:sensor histidine kinase [Paenibacillus sp. FSL A5-0031]OME86631.1 two-component sensor histidine kinase [Paenibacillus sp. FSL A5-0031]